MVCGNLLTASESAARKNSERNHKERKGKADSAVSKGSQNHWHRHTFRHLLGSNWFHRRGPRGSIPVTLVTEEMA